MKILLLDNYDSFTYNLAHLIEEITGNLPDVFRNDAIEIENIKNYKMLFLSPGPGIPEEAGILKKSIQEYAGKIPIFGVCLGMQAIVEVFGGRIENMKKVYHGVATTMKITDKKAFIFKDIPENFQAGRYHSWVAKKKDFPKAFKITSEDLEGKIMSLEHKKFPISAVQFHPESILTPFGKNILENFIKIYCSFK